MIYDIILDVPNGYKDACQRVEPIKNHSPEVEIIKSCQLIENNRVAVPSHQQNEYQAIGFTDFSLIDHSKMGGPVICEATQPAGWQVYKGLGHNDYIFDETGALRLMTTQYRDVNGEIHFQADIKCRLQLCEKINKNNITTTFYLTDKDKPIFVIGTVKGITTMPEISDLREKLQDLLQKVFPGVTKPENYWADELGNKFKNLANKFQQLLNADDATPVMPASSTAMRL